jgi:hypothetical protein
MERVATFSRARDLNDLPLLEDLRETLESELGTELRSAIEIAMEKTKHLS